MTATINITEPALFLQLTTTDHINNNTYPNQTSGLLGTNRCGLDLRQAELPVLLLSTLIVNLVALVVLMRMRGTYDTLDHHLVSLLNINDLMTTAIYTFMWLSGWATCDRLLQMRMFCGVFGWLGSSLVVWSAGIVIIMTTCRYLSLVKPLYYRANVNTKTVNQGAVGTLGFCLLFFAFPFTGLTAPFAIYRDNHICATEFAPGITGVGQRVFIGCTGAIGGVTVAVVVVCNLIIVRTLRQRNVIHTEISSAGTTRNHTNVSGKRRIFGHVTLVVSFVYALCYAPFVVRLLVDTIVNRDHQNYIIHSVSLILLFLSPLLNPIIYGLFNKHFRRTFLAMFKLPSRSPSQLGNSGTGAELQGRAYLEPVQNSESQQRVRIVGVIPIAEAELRRSSGFQM